MSQPAALYKENNPKAERYLAVQLCIVDWYSDDQPGWVECQLVDAHGKAWTILEKAPVVTSADLDRNSAYPQPTTIKAALLGVTRDVANREIITIDTAHPWGIEATDGTTRFDILADQLVGSPTTLCSNRYHNRMTITIEIPPELEEPLLQAAQRKGMDIHAYFLDLLRRYLRDVLPESESHLLKRNDTPVPEEKRAENARPLTE